MSYLLLLLPNSPQVKSIKMTTPHQQQQPLVEAKSLAVFSDGISALSYLPSQVSHVAATSWDGTIRIHDTSASPSSVLTHAMEVGPLLCLATPAGGTTVCATGGMDGSGTCDIGFLRHSCFLLYF